MVDSTSKNRWVQFPTQFKGRPFPLKLMAVGLIVFSVLCWMRIGQALIDAKLLTQFTLAPLSLYWVITGTLWGILGIVALIFLWLRYTWSLWLIGISAALFTAWYWLDRAFIQNNPGRWSSWLFILILNILILIFIYSTIAYLHPDRFQTNNKEISHEQ